jgi:hypothetical protein
MTISAYGWQDTPDSGRPRNPDGSSVVIVVADGPGAETLMGEFATSDNEFDKWFTERAAQAHGFDFSAPPPPPAERRI